MQNKVGHAGSQSLCLLVILLLIALQFKDLKAVSVSSESYWSLSNLYGQVWMDSSIVWFGDFCCILHSSFQFSSAISKVQLKMLQITSRSAQQSISIRCRNLETEGKHPTFKGFSRGVQVTPQLLSNGCKVRKKELNHMKE